MPQRAARLRLCARDGWRWYVRECHAVQCSTGGSRTSHASVAGKTRLCLEAAALMKPSLGVWINCANLASCKWLSSTAKVAALFVAHEAVLHELTKQHSTMTAVQAVEIQHDSLFLETVTHVAQQVSALAAWEQLWQDVIKCYATGSRITVFVDEAQAVRGVDVSR